MVVVMIAGAFVIGWFTYPKGLTVQSLTVAAWGMFVCLPILRLRQQRRS